MRNLADQVLRTAETAPSFDGQFGPKVRALAAQAHTELTRRASDVRESAERLCDIAARFEQVDLETVAGMEGLALRMQGWVDRSVGVLRWVRAHLASLSPRGCRVSIQADEETTRGGRRSFWAGNLVVV
jgi:hypothetical protein